MEIPQSFPIHPKPDFSRLANKNPLRHFPAPGYNCKDPPAPLERSRGPRIWKAVCVSAVICPSLMLFSNHQCGGCWLQVHARAQKTKHEVSKTAFVGSKKRLWTRSRACGLEDNTCGFGNRASWFAENACGLKTMRACTRITPVGSKTALVDSKTALADSTKKLWAQKQHLWASRQHLWA